MTSSPSYGDVGMAFQNSRAQLKSAAHEAEGYTQAMGLDALGKVKTAEAQAPGIVAGGAAQGGAAQAEGFAGMMNGIAGGIGKMNFGGGSQPTGGYAGSMNVPGFGSYESGTQFGIGAGGGSVGGYGTFGPNWGYPSP